LAKAGEASSVRRSRRRRRIIALNVALPGGNLKFAAD
jgi:hypothetical protein